jgi:hypothetical protein
MVDAGMCPVVLDLRKYAIEGRHPQGAESSANLLADIMRVGSVPRRTPHELERLAKEARLTVLVDGLNEISREARTALIDYLANLRKEGTCYSLVTDRFGPPESFPGFSHATVDKLDSTTVGDLFDREFGRGSFAQLDKQLQRIYWRPFFLDLALKIKQKFAGATVWSGIFRDFFLTQLRMTSQELELVAKSTLKAHEKDGSFALDRLREMVGENIYQILINAEVLRKDEGGFEHHLWRDYLFSHDLAGKDGEWNDSVFDVVTTFSSSLECLSLTVEQLPDRVQTDNFLKKIFDWSYLAAIDCIADFRDDDPEPHQLSVGIRSAILAAVAEKRFDPIERTRQRANEFLRYHLYELARPFREAQTREELAQHVASLDGTGDWFEQWKALFTRGSGGVLSAEEIDFVISDDSIIGWTAANLARQSQLDEPGLQRIREMYRKAGNSEEKKGIRWRVVHVLGAHPNTGNVDFLVEALSNDLYRWVKYGAVRSLMEIASRSEGDLRERALRGVGEFVESYNPGELWVRRRILQEVTEAAFVRRPQPSWRDAARPILALAAQRIDPPYRDVLNRRIAEFSGYDDESN